MKSFKKQRNYKVKIHFNVNNKNKETLMEVIIQN
jgi:hypothetical protein